jgi:hypothetical protein
MPSVRCAARHAQSSPVTLRAVALARERIRASGRRVPSVHDEEDPVDESMCDEGNCDRFGGTEPCRCYGTTEETTEGGW